MQWTRLKRQAGSGPKRHGQKTDRKKRDKMRQILSQYRYYHYDSNNSPWRLRFVETDCCVFTCINVFVHMHVSVIALCYCIMFLLASDCLITSHSSACLGSDVWKQGQRESFNFPLFVVTQEHMQYRVSTKTALISGSKL